MEISSIGEILRRNANRQKYNSGFFFYKNNKKIKYIRREFAHVKNKKL